MSERGRGVSDVVGYVLLIGVVTAGIATVLVLGGSAVSDLKGDAEAEAVESSLGQADRRLAALQGTRVNTTRFQLRAASPGQVRVLPPDESGHINVSMNGGACSTQLPLSTVVYDQENSGQTALQAGGKFAVAADGESSTVTAPPSVSARNGTISVTTYNLSGFVDDRTVAVEQNVTLSERASARTNEELINGTACQRPDSMTITVQSAYYDAWAEYLQSETGVPTSTNAGARTATVTLPQSWLPPRADDSANHVVNLSDDSIATVVSDGGPTSAPSYVDSSSTDNISINKGAGNTYSAVALPIGNGTQSSYVKQVQSQTVFRQPIDVVFVIDDSGSMDDGDKGTDYAYYPSYIFWGCGGWCSTPEPGEQQKIVAAKDSAKDFVGQTNSSVDRTAVVGFDNDSEYYPTDTDRRYFTNDSAAANDSLEDLEADDGTDYATGMSKANAVHDLGARSGSERVVIMLGDGENFGSDSRARELAQQAAANNITYYTVGFGSGINGTSGETLLEDIAQTTGGEYAYAEDASDLDTVFTDIFAAISSTDAIVHQPTSSQLTVGGETVRPQLGYANPDVNRINGSYDINDPAYRGGFEFSARASDGNLVDVTAVSYDCEPGAFEFTDAFVNNETNNQTYRRVRCTDIDNSSRQVVSPDETSIYLDGASASSLPSGDAAWYQDDLLNDTLAGYVEGGELDLASNEAVVVFDYDTGTTESRIVMLYRIGLSEEDTSVDVAETRVVNATVGGN